MNKTELRKLSTDSIRRWLARHDQAVAVGMNVSQLDRHKAQAFRLELIRRNV